jgi:hypothetical protein
MHVINSFAYCYPLANIISLDLAQSDPIKQCLMYTQGYLLEQFYDER